MGGSVRIGLLRLADAAPAIVAAEWGVFARHGLDATLSVEPSWANVADKLSYNLLDAAVMLPPLAMAMAAGLREPRTRLLVPMGLSRGGNTVVLSATAAAAVEARLSDPDLHGPEPHDVDARGRAVAAWLRHARESGTPPRLGVVHLFSSHNLLLRHWLAANGADPDRDATLVVLPPAEMGPALAAGRIDGFCAGAPWGTVARRAGHRVIARGSEIRPGGGEKVLAVRRDWAEADPGRLQTLLQALRDAAALCDDPSHTDALAALLAGPDYVDTDAAAIRPSLAGAPFSDAADPISFGNALAVDPTDARWFADAMRRWTWLPDGERAAAEAVYQPLAADAAPMNVP